MKIGFFGTGLMGFPMCEQLLAAGHSLTVFNRSREKAAPLAAKGAVIAEDSREVIKKSVCVMMMLTDHQAINEVAFQNKASDYQDRTFIQMGTIAPSHSRALKERFESLGADYFEAPVMGNMTHILKRELQVMVGSTKEQFAKWKEVFSAFGPDPLYIGEVGKAAAMKLALNHLIAAEITAFSASLGFIQKEGIEVETFMNVLRGSANYSKAFDNKLDRLIRRDYGSPNFSAQNLLKDISLFEEDAGKDGIETICVESMMEVIRRTMQAGYSDADYSALNETVNPSKK